MCYQIGSSQNLQNQERKELCFSGKINVLTREIAALSRWYSVQRNEKYPSFAPRGSRERITLYLLITLARAYNLNTETS